MSVCFDGSFCTDLLLYWRVSCIGGFHVYRSVLRFIRLVYESV